MTQMEVSPHAVGPSRRYRLSSSVASQIADGEAVLIHFDTGSYYSVDPVGTEIMRLATDEGRALAEVLAILVESYDVSVADLGPMAETFLDQLEAERLIVPDPGASASHGKPPRERTNSRAKLPFSAPALQKYSDLEELLALDPIHEVAEDGWPAARPRIEQEGE
jgi:hypothetical protein